MKCPVNMWKENRATAGILGLAAFKNLKLTAKTYSLANTRTFMSEIRITMLSFCAKKTF